MRLLVALAIACLTLVSQAAAQGQLDAGDGTGLAAEGEVVVLDSELERWVSREYWTSALCRETLRQLIYEHQAFTNETGLANAQKLFDQLAGLIDTARTEMLAKGLSFEQSVEIDSYFHGATQPKTARYMDTTDAGALAVDLRVCPAAAAALEESLAAAPARAALPAGLEKAFWCQATFRVLIAENVFSTQESVDNAQRMLAGLENYIRTEFVIGNFAYGDIDEHAARFDAETRADALAFVAQRDMRLLRHDINTCWEVARP